MREWHNLIRKFCRNQDDIERRGGYLGRQFSVDSSCLHVLQVEALTVVVLYYLFRDVYVEIV